MKSPIFWKEKLGFKRHLIAWLMIRRSVKERIRCLGYDPERLESEWEALVFVEYRNGVIMECCADDLRLSRKLVREEAFSNHARREPSQVLTWLAKEKQRITQLDKHRTNSILYAMNE